MLDRKTSKIVGEVVNKLYDLEDLETPVSVQEINRFMLDCLELVRNECPEVAKNAISVAELFCSGDASPEELKEVNHACWSYLKKRNASTNTEEKKFCMVRAVICALVSDVNSDYLGELFEFFVEMMCKSGDYKYTVRDQLIAHFLS